MSINVAIEYLKQFNADARIKEFKVSSATVELSVSYME